MSRFPLAAHHLLIEPEETAPVEAHVHDSPQSLAIDLAETQDLIELACCRAATCSICHSALLTLDYWLATLDHSNPLVGPEYLTRHRLFADLFDSPQSHAERLARLRSDEIFHNWGLCRFFLDESAEAFPIALEWALHLAELALAVAERLDEAFYEAGPCADLRAQSAAQLSVIHRHLGDDATSEHHAAAARTWLEAGTGRSWVAERLQNTVSLLSRGLPSHAATLRIRRPADSDPEAHESLLPAGPLRRFFRS